MRVNVFASALKWKLTEWDGEWSLFYLTANVGGVQRGIDGNLYLCDPATQSWSGCADMPRFNSAEECIEWANSQGIEFLVEG